jgi:hypothetical protein
MTYDQLISHFIADLNLFNHSWITPMRQVVIKLFQAMVSDDVAVAIAATVACFILPGLISDRRKARALTGAPRLARIDSPIAALRHFDSAADTAEAILEMARAAFTAAEPRAAAAQPRRNQLSTRITKLTQRAETACAAGRISVAARVLAELEPLLGGAEAQLEDRPPISAAARAELVASLFPESNDDDILGDGEGDTEPFELSYEDVQSSLASLPTDRAAGHSGWTNRLLRKLAMGGSPADTFVFSARLTAVYNHLLTGKAAPELHALWATSRLVFIPKDENAYRPIGIGEILYRVMGSTIIRIEGPRLATILQPHQLAVGVSGGVEIAAVLADLGYGDGDTGTMCVDVSNAFNSVRRRLMYEGIALHFPAILPFFKWFYGRAIQLRDNRGTIVGHATSGCLQGDPLSSAYFALATYPILRRLDEALRLAEQAAGITIHRGLVVAIADDLTLQAATPVLFTIAPTVVEIFAEYGLRINLGKSGILSPSATTTPNPPEGWSLHDDGGKTLGRPLGTKAAQEAWLESLLQRRGPSIQALQHIKPQDAWIILRSSSNRRFDYVHKVTSKLFGERHFQAHDQRIDTGLMRIAAAPMHEHIREVRELPIDLGGLSLPSTTGIESMQHYLITQQRTQLFIVKYYPYLRAVHQQRFYSEEDEGTIYSELRERTEALYQLLGDDAPLMRGINMYKRAAKLSAKDMLAARARHLQQTLAASPHSRPMAAGLLSAMTANTGQWLRCTSLPMYGTGIKFSDNAFLEMLRNRLLCPFTSFYGPAPGFCACSVRVPVSLAAVPMHPLVCHTGKTISNERHDRLRDRLAKLIRVVLPESNTRIEPDNHMGILLEPRPDIYYEEQGVPKYIDVVVAEPTAQIYTNHPTLSSVTHENAAAIASERRKRGAYAAANQGIDMEPFAIESTGRLGPSAQALLTKFCTKDINAQALRDFLFDTSFILATSKGNILAECRRKLARRNEDMH